MRVVIYPYESSVIVEFQTDKETQKLTLTASQASAAGQSLLNASQIAGNPVLEVDPPSVVQSSVAVPS